MRERKKESWMKVFVTGIMYVHVCLYTLFIINYMIYLICIIVTYNMYDKIDTYNYFKVGMIRSWFWTDLRFYYSFKSGSTMGS